MTGTSIQLTERCNQLEAELGDILRQAELLDHRLNSMLAALAVQPLLTPAVVLFPSGAVSLQEPSRGLH